MLEGNFVHLCIDDLKFNVWCARGENDTYTIFGKDGNVIWQGIETSGTDISVSQYDMIIYKTTDDYDTLYFSLKDNDYTVNGVRSYLPFIVEVADEDDGYDVVDLRNNNTLIEGYKDYKYTGCIDGQAYVYAEKVEGGYDIFLIK